MEGPGRGALHGVSAHRRGGLTAPNRGRKTCGSRTSVLIQPALDWGPVLSAVLEALWPAGKDLGTCNLHRSDRG